VLDCYSRHVSKILDFGLTKDIMMRKTVDSSAKLTGQNIRETIWEKMNNGVVNKMLVIWMEVQPFNKSGKLKSGTENYEPSLFELRKKLFDIDKKLLFQGKEDEKVGPMDVNATVVSANTQVNVEKKKRGRKASVPGGKADFDPEWFPLEWLAFKHFGPLSQTPYEPWISVATGRARDKPIETHNEEEAGDDDAEDETTPRHDLGRNAQRKKRREEKRSDPRNVPSCLPFWLGHEWLG